MNITSLPANLSMFKNLVSLDLSNNPIEDYESVGKSLSTLPKLKELHIDLITIENVEIILNNLPNLKTLNDKPIQPNLFTEQSPNENIDNNENDENNNNIDNNIVNNDNIDENFNQKNENEIPDCDIESEIQNYDVSIIFLIKIIYYRK